jgi:lysophospholipase L1-like esterase
VAAVLRRSTILGIALVTISASLTMLGLELAVRIHRGRVLVQSATTDLRQDRIRPFVYHPRLGWIPTPGQLSRGWTSNVDASSIRSNGRSTSTASRPILAVGDSFTFGNEVEDGETWAANLERILNKCVLNGGVGAYGIDQAFLRAELLLEQYDPDVVILAFISDDINRTEYSYYPYGRGWKPYFTYENGALSLRNVPVPQEPAPTAYRGFQSLRRALGYSLLADAVLDRIARQWWRNLPVVERIHRDGEDVSVDLFVRLDGLTRARNGQFIAVALATNGRIGDNARTPNLVKRAREKDVTVLDLSTEMLKLQPNQLQTLFRLDGHYSPAMNRAVAEHIAAFLRDGAIRSLSESARPVP